MRLASLLALVAAVASAQPRYTTRECSRTPGGRSTRGIPCEAGAFFEFAPASGAGIPSAQTLCSAAAQHFSGKDVSWCTNGDGTAASGTTLSVATEQGTVTETTQPMCPNGLDCASVAVMRPTTTTSGYAEAANVDRSASVTTGSFTACVAFVHQTDAAARTLAALTANGALPGKYYLGFGAGGDVAAAAVPTTACGAGGTSVTGSVAYESGAPGVACLTWAASDGVFRLYTNGVADGTSAAYTTICGGAANSRFTVGGYWNLGATTSSPTLGGILGAFYLDTTTGNGGQLSAAQILALSNAVLARNPTGAKGETLTFTRATPRFCESSTGLGSVVPSGAPCIGKNGYNAWPLGTVISARSNELDNAYWTATAAVTANQARAPDGTLSADQLNDSSGAASQGVSVAIASTSATQHTFACFVSAGTTDQATISITGTGSATGDCTASFTGISAAGQWISCSSPAAYAGTLTTVTPSLVVGDNVADTGTIFASYCNHYTTAPGRGPAIRTVAAGATRNADSLVTTLSSAVGPSACVAGSVAYDTSATLAGLQAVASLGPTTATPSMTIGKQSNTTLYLEIVAGGPTTTNPVVSAIGTTTHRVLLADNAGTRTAFWDQGSVAAPASSMTSAQGRFVIGDYAATATPQAAGGTVSRIQIDPDPTRCVP